MTNNKKVIRVRHRIRPSRLLKSAWVFLFLLMTTTITLIVIMTPQRELHPVKHVLQNIPNPSPSQKKPPPMTTFGLQQYTHSIKPMTNKKKLVFVINNIGLQNRLLEKILKSLPAATTLSFSPYTPNLSSLMTTLWQEGHELCLTLPVQPLENHDRGPYVLSAQNAIDSNLNHLNQILKRGSHFIGVSVTEENQLIHFVPQMTAIYKILKTNKLLYMDVTSGLKKESTLLAKKVGVPYVKPTMYISATLTPIQVDDRLQQLTDEMTAPDITVVVVDAAPLLLTKLISWYEKYRQMIQVVPLSMTLQEN